MVIVREGLSLYSKVIGAVFIIVNKVLGAVFIIVNKVLGAVFNYR